MKRILFVFSSTSAGDRAAWSGTIYQSYQGLSRAGYEVDYLCAVRDSHDGVIDKLLWRYWSHVPKLVGKNVRVDETFYSVRVFKDTLSSFDYTPYDVIFVPTHIAIVNALPKNIKAKIVHLADATVDSLFDYYSEFSNLLCHNYKEAHILGKQAFRRSDLLIVSSDWCKSNAVADYGVDPKKIAVIEFGANIDDMDIPALPKKINENNSLNIYWSGVNWTRKGGDVAIECCNELLKRGYKVTFHITGIKKDDPLSKHLSCLPYVKNHGFLSKNNPNEYKELIRILEEMDIFLFPSRAECSSIALCEANGFGLPCYVYDTGGTANYVLNGVNGYMLPMSAGAIEFADKIEENIKNKELNSLSSGAVEHYKTHLNWDVWSKRVTEVIDKL